MAFPLDPTHLRAHLRALLLLSKEGDDDSASRIIRPLELGLFHENLNKLYFNEYRPKSPPIPDDIPDDAPGENPLRLTNKKSSSRSRRRARKSQNTQEKHNDQTREKQKNDAEGQPAILQMDLREYNTSNSLVLTIPLDAVSPSETIAERSNEKRTLLSKLFNSAPLNLGTLKKLLELRSPTLGDTLFDQISDLPVVLSRMRTNTSKFSSEHDLDKQLILGSIATAEIVTPKDGLATAEESDKNTIEQESDVTSSNSYTSDDSLPSSSSSDMSSFSDESIRNEGSNMMYNYSVPESHILANENALFASPHKLNTEHADGVSRAGPGMNALTSGASSLSFGKQQDAVHVDLQFHKLRDEEIVKEEKHSLLSSMISNRQGVINENPLSYFAFVSPDAASGRPESDTKQTKIDVFVPPRPECVLQEVSIVTTASIFDCIGYFVSQVILTKEYEEMKNDESFINPNNWRMELIDSDGDLYDSTFGVLDRSRLLSSYNCPRYLAICQVTNPIEIEKNNKQTPLPLEFKQHLEAYRERAANLSQRNTDFYERDLGALPDDSVQVQVADVPNQKQEYIKIHVPATMQIGGLFELICGQYQVNPTEYKLVGIDSTHIRREIFMSELISDVKAQEGQEIALESTSKIEDLGMFTFRLVSSTKQIVKLMLNVAVDSETQIRAGITPESSSLIQSAITPPPPETLKISTTIGKSQASAKLATKPAPLKKRRNSKITELLFDNHNFDDQFKSKSPDIPTAVNTVYFKWKVFRKKPPLLNRIEKSLIIDGDYIHIVPPDDVNLKKTASEAMYGGSHSENKHHHHYLHHYNYSKYYNDTMMKTSSFHVSQIIKLKHFKKGKNPLQFKIVVEKETDQGGKEAVIQKKYDLEAENDVQLKDMIKKIEWAWKSYERSLAA